jgi:hypothetical protein
LYKEGQDVDSGNEIEEKIASLKELMKENR